MNFHCYAFLDPSYPEGTVYWIHKNIARKDAFDWVKKKAKASDYELIMFDGEVYQYDHGNGKFIKQKWEHIEWDSDK